MATGVDGHTMRAERFVGRDRLGLTGVVRQTMEGLNTPQANRETEIRAAAHALFQTRLDAEIATGRCAPPEHS